MWGSGAALPPGQHASEETGLPKKGASREMLCRQRVRIPQSLETSGSLPGWPGSGSPSTCQYNPGASQAVHSRKLIRFPRKDAQRDGQIELGVPGTQLQESSCKAAPPSQAAAPGVCSSLVYGPRVGPALHVLPFCLKLAHLRNEATDVLGSSVCDRSPWQALHHPTLGEGRHTSTQHAYILAACFVHTLSMCVTGPCAV